MTYQEIIDGIKSLKIQGAEKIALAAVEAFGLKLKETQDYATLEKAYQELAATRVTEPALRNSVMYCLKNYQKNPNVAADVIKYFQESKEKIAEIGANKIQNGMVVFTHCHSSTVEAILVKAWREGKRFEVYNTETRPKFQGRITAENLAKAGIPVTHFVDSAGRHFMKKADLFLFGCDAVTVEGNVYNKIGTEPLAAHARELGIGAYSVTNSWKFDPATINGNDVVIEERSADEVWPDAPKGIKIMNPAFEVTPADLITGIITELGVVKPEALITEVQQKFPWMF